MKKRYGLEAVASGRRKFILRIIIIIAAIFLLSFLPVFCYKFIHDKILKLDSVSAMYDNWNKHTLEGYKKVYQISTDLLESNPLHNTALTFKGYSSFMLAESETESTQAQLYLNESIFNLRKSLQNCDKKSIPQIKFMLGRAYFYKNKASSYHYYAELVIKYLEEAVELKYESDSIPLMLGLSYAQLGEKEKSIQAFSEALLVRETDTLLFDIAKQYFDMDQRVSKQYLARVLDVSSNEKILKEAHYLLGQIYINEENYEQSEKEFNTMLEMDKNSADAHYGLGLLYEKQGNVIKARDEWKKCLRFQFNHSEALKKMNNVM